MICILCVYQLIILSTLIKLDIPVYALRNEKWGEEKWKSGTLNKIKNRNHPAIKILSQSVEQKK